MKFKMNGKTEWFIGDGFMSNTQKGDCFSRDCMCFKYDFKKSN